MMSLDVGCGNNPKGTVNVDLYIKDTLNHRNKNHDTLNVHNIPNFICASATYLPFRNAIFDKIFSGQVIEHLDNPQEFIKELSRVANYGAVVTVETVHRLGENVRARHEGKKSIEWVKTHHVSKFNFFWLQKVFIMYGLKVEKCYVNEYATFPNDILVILRFPYEIGVTGIKVS